MITIKPNPKLTLLLVGIVCISLTALGASVLTHSKTRLPKQSISASNQKAEVNINELKSKAAAGDTLAQRLLGWHYMKGEGVRKNYQKSYGWYLQAAEAEFKKEVLKRAENGDGDAQYQLGYCYDCGIGTERNPPEAVKWYQKAAEQNISEAAWYLGQAFKYGKGTKMDVAEAVRWLLKASELGCSEAFGSLGDIYEDKKYGIQSFEEARKWYEKGAEVANPGSLVGLAKLYENGVGVSEDLVEAYKWLELAKSTEPSYYGIHETMATLIGRLSRVEALDAKKRASAFVFTRISPKFGSITSVTWPPTLQALTKKAETDVDAQIVLGLAYFYFRSPSEQNEIESEFWIRKASNSGNLDALFHVEEQWGTNEMDQAKAFLAAAANGYAPAQIKVGVGYEKGFWGFAKNEKEAESWCRKAADQGSADAQVKLGELYYSRDKREAVGWYLKAAEQGDNHAQWGLGNYYADPDSEIRDEKEAAKWLRKAADQGAEYAREKLGVLYFSGEIRNYVESAKCFTALAKKGHAPSQELLARQYLCGLGVQKDYNTAWEWFEKAAKHEKLYDLQESTPPGYFLRALRSEYGYDEFEKNYTNAAGNYRLAVDETEPPPFNAKEHFQYLLAEPSPNANPIAMYRLGLLFGQGLGVPLDLMEAYKWVSLASDQGYEPASKAKRSMVTKLTDAQKAEAEKRCSNIYSITNKGGGTARDLKVIDIDQAGITCTHGQGAAIKINFEEMGNASKRLFLFPGFEFYLKMVNPEYFEKEAPRTRSAPLTKGNEVGTTISAKTALTFGDVDVVSAATRLTEINSVNTRWAWKIVLKNKTKSSIQVKAKIEHLDNGGFNLSDDYDILSIGAGQTVPVTGQDYISAANYLKVSAIKITVTPR